MASTLADAAARRRIAEDLDTTLIVEAAAGTGKTTELVGRIVSVVATGHRGATLESIIAVTFTEKAAGEMKLRLREALEKTLGLARADDPAHQRLEHALSQLEVARIGTIHSVCADLLREHPVAARVDPLFEVTTEPEAKRFLDSVFDQWFQRTLADPPEGVRRLLRRRPRRKDRLPPRELLREAAWDLVEHRDFDAPWRRETFDRDPCLDQLVSALHEVGALASLGRERDPLAINLKELQRFIEDLDHREAVAERDYDGLEAELSELARHWSWKRTGRGNLYAKGYPREKVLGARDAVKNQLEDVLTRCEAELAAYLHAELKPLVADYDEAKAAAGKLDFFDLLLRTRDLLTKDRGVRTRLQGRFTHLFVDEFQDTDPLQADMLRLLAAAEPGETDPEEVRLVPGKLFIVGDPKQSIYRFRRADVALYERVKRKLLASGASIVDLTTSFRGSPEIQQAVNAAFAPVMADGGATQARYVPLTPFRQPLANQPALIALPVPRPYNENGYITNYAIDASYPDAVAAFIEFLVRKSNWTVLEPGSDERVRIQPRHVCILFKRFRAWEGADVTIQYTRALENRRIPHVLVGGRSFHARDEILALRNALTAIEWPEDELSVYATLRGPLFALSDDALLVFRSVSGSLHPFKRLELDSLPPAARDVAEGLAVLKGLHLARNRTPIADTISQLLETTRASASFAFWTAGDQALANVAQLLDIARRFENSGARSFRAFVDHLHEEAELGEAPDAPIVEEGTEGVRMMTVHSAKGLEFPVVILADPTAPQAPRNATHWVDPDKKLWVKRLAWCTPAELSEHADEVLRREREQSIRLTYVAATRARDLLVVPVLGVPHTDEDRQEGWVDVLYPAFFPRPDESRSPQVAAGCPPFSTESVLDELGSVSVSPGLHRPRVGGHSVVWWDPATLHIDIGDNPGLHRDEVLREDDRGVNAAESSAAYEAWLEERMRLLERGAMPSIRLVAAREVSGLAGVAVEHAATDVKREGRPGGRRFGELVHVILADVSLTATLDDVARMANMHGRSLGSPDDEVRAAVEAVSAALRHPLLSAAARSAAVRRESPVSLELEDGTLAEGVVDLAFKEEAGWAVVDFKTADELDAYRGAFEAQVAVYVTAIARATGLATRGVLLGV
jgi:ATP-dependent exoDNAse (exonuclease V) beta subunit